MTTSTAPGPDRAGERAPGRSRDRSPNLGEARVGAIVRLVRRLPGKPSWDAVVSAVEERFECRYTRQALFAHLPIRLAYQERRSGSPVRPRERPVSERARAAAGAKARLLAELAEVRRREELLLERIAKWMYNAHANGIPISMLDAELGGSRAEAAGTAPRPGPAGRPDRRAGRGAPGDAGARCRDLGPVAFGGVPKRRATGRDGIGPEGGGMAGMTRSRNPAP